MAGEETGLVVDCGTGQGYEMVLDAPGELGSIEDARALHAREKAAEVRRQSAVQNLRIAALTDQNMRDLLIVLGLE
jgi:hypothetical protein